jgi:hypothetical protein
MYNGTEQCVLFKEVKTDAKLTHLVTLQKELQL